jgi:hypothetical protein
MHVSIATTFVVFGGLLLPHLCRADEPSNELQVLNYYVGKWDVEITGRSRGKGIVTGEWVLDGQFLRQTWSVEASPDNPRTSGIVMMTYDAEKKVYRSWSFSVKGAVRESQGVWDPHSRTMTWTRRNVESGETVVLRSSFVDDATESWSIVKADANANILGNMTGKNTRRDSK